MKNSQNKILELQEEKIDFEKKLQRMELNEKKFLQEINQIKEAYFLLEERKKNDDLQHNHVIQV